MAPTTDLTLLPPLKALTDIWIADTARAAGEPAWLIERRVAAWQQFAAMPPPIWRRTDLTKIDFETLTASWGTQATTLAGDAPQGVVVMPLAEAVRTHGDLVRQYLGTAIDMQTHRFTALQAALWQEGAFVYVPKNTAVELPLHALVTLPEGANMVVAHNLVVLERGASLTLVEEFSGVPHDGAAFALPATELILQEGSSLKYVTLQNWADGMRHIGVQRAVVGRDASLDWAALSLGGTLQHVEAETALQGDGSHVDWVAATMATGAQQLLTAPWLRHIGTNTEGHMDFKTVVKDTSYTTFDGMIKIEKDSRRTVSRLEEHALHLTPKARSDSIPGLKIDTNDVAKAGHASTSGQIEEEHLFYMQSRGIRRNDAMHMIVMGFFEPVIDRIPPEQVREQVAAAIEARI